MELVLDPYDPTGMFSKAGRSSVEMYQMILQRDRILYNKPRENPPKRPIFNEGVVFSKNPQSLQEKPNVQQNSLEKVLPQIKAKIEPFSKMKPREILNRIEKEDRRFGMYNPKYNLIFEKSIFYESNEEKEANISKIQELRKNKNRQNEEKKRKALSCHLEKSQIRKNSNEIIEFDPFKSKIKGPVPLKFQLGRDYFSKNSKEVHEKRFESFELPEVFSKTQKVKRIYLDGVGRSRNNFKKDNCAMGLEYKPKYNLVWPKTAMKIPDFSKNIARKSLSNSINYSLNLSYEDESLNSKRKIIKTPNFSKMLPRDRSLEESPSFKQN